MNNIELPKITKFQKKVIADLATEPPFDNKYYNNGEEGIYVDAISGEALFISNDKYDSGTGWPSFSKSISKDVIFKKDNKFNMNRIEVTSKVDTHLGHVFEDNQSCSGKRFCINSASLYFIPKSQLKNTVYEKILIHFKN